MSNNSLESPSNKRQINNEDITNIVDQMGNLVLNEDEISGSDYQRMFEPKRAIFTFGRFQPPTIGHNNLIEKLIRTSKSLNARPFVFVSLTQNALEDTKWKKALRKVQNINKYITKKENENPLSPDIKIEILNKMYPNSRISFINGAKQLNRIYSIQRAIDFLSKEFDDIYLIVGSKRYSEFKQMNFENKYNITLVKNERILDGDFPRESNLYELGNLTPEQINDITKPKAKLISGTATRQAAAEHRIIIPNPNEMEIEQVKELIYSGQHRIKRDIGFINFKKRMKSNLTDQDIEYYIYLIKKGMGLSLIKEYRNQKRELTRKSSRFKGGRRRKKKTRKKRGGVLLKDEDGYYVLYTKEQLKDYGREGLIQQYLFNYTTKDGKRPIWLTWPEYVEIEQARMLNSAKRSDEMSVVDIPQMMNTIGPLEDHDVAIEKTEIVDENIKRTFYFDKYGVPRPRVKFKLSQGGGRKKKTRKMRGGKRRKKKTRKKRGGCWPNCFKKKSNSNSGQFAKTTGVEEEEMPLITRQQRQKEYEEYQRRQIEKRKKAGTFVRIPSMNTLNTGKEKVEQNLRSRSTSPIMDPGTAAHHNLPENHFATIDKLLDEKGKKGLGGGRKTRNKRRKNLVDKLFSLVGGKRDKKTRRRTKRRKM